VGGTHARILDGGLARDKQATFKLLHECRALTSHAIIFISICTTHGGSMALPLPSRIALFPLAICLFPGATLSLHLFEPRYLKLMRERAELDPIFGVVLTKEGREVGDEPEIHTVGTAASLVTAVQHDDGRFSMVVQGTQRFRVGDRDWDRGYLMADVEWLPSTEFESGGTLALADDLQGMFIDYVIALADQLGNQRAKRELPDAISGALAINPEIRAFQIAAQLPLNTWQQQSLLEIDALDERLTGIVELVRRERRLVQIAGPATAPESHPGSKFSSN
jgi:Lon protease-like protein